MRYQDTSIEVFSEESCLKPIDPLAKVIQHTSPGDMLLFMIALDKKKRAEKKQFDKPE